jgi:hypothetical protein
MPAGSRSYVPDALQLGMQSVPAQISKQRMLIPSMTQLHVDGQQLLVLAL